MKRPQTKVEAALSSLAPRPALRIARLHVFTPYVQAYDRESLVEIGWFDLGIPEAIERLQAALQARGYCAPQITKLQCGSPFDGRLCIS